MSKTKRSGGGNSVPFVRMLGIELRRGLQERVFWVMVVILFLFCVISMVLYEVWPVSLYYIGGKKGLSIWGHWGTNVDQACNMVLNNTLWRVYFPFLGAVAYAHVLPDERRNGYAWQIIMREGFGKYITVKLCAVSVLGGVMGAVPIVVTAISAFLLIHVNPFLQEAVQYYRQTQEEVSFFRYWMDSDVWEEISLTEALLLGMVSWFLLGMLFGLVAGMIGLWTENKLMIYTLPVVGLQLWDVCVYLLSTHGLSKFYIKSYMGKDGLGCLDVYPVCGILLIILVCISILLYPKVRERYKGEGI